MVEVEESDSDEEVPLHALSINTMRHRVSQMYETVHIGGKPLCMEIDTGAAVSVINNEDYKKLNLQYPLDKTDIILNTYTKEKVVPLGVCSVDVEYKDKSHGPLELYVLNSANTPPLLGRA